MAEYGSMFLVSALAAILFFGGWNGPVPIFSEILPAITGLKWAYEPGETSWRVLGYVSQVAGVMNVLFKATIGVTFMMWVRWTLPRLRIDQVLTTCLKYCVPLAAMCFVGVILWQLWGLPTGNWLLPMYRPHEVRESWVLAEETTTESSAESARPAKTDDGASHGKVAGSAAGRSAPNLSAEVQP
jgi:NADH-quinone oxidoreductase subunit H